MYNPACQAPGGKFSSDRVPSGGFPAPQNGLNRLPHKDLLDCLRGFLRFLIRIASEKLPFAAHSPELARHSPEILCRELRCASREELFEAHSPFFGRREELVEPRDLRGMGREGPLGWREVGGMAHSLPVAPLELEIAAFFLAFGWREGEGMGREEQGMKREEVFAEHEAPSEWEEAGGMRLAGHSGRRNGDDLIPLSPVVTR